MKKILTLAAMTLIALSASAQVNVQLHYDLGRNINEDALPNRPKVTSTVEMFKADRLGSNYFFIDFDYYSDGVAGAYWEVSREFTFWQAASGADTWAAHIEYDGGMSNNKYAERNSAFATSRFQQCFLLGPAWNWHSADFSRTFSLQLMYKQYIRQHATYNAASDLKAIASFQTTAVWGITFAQGWCTFSGFVDLWYGYTPRFSSNGAQKKGLVVLSEPQFWVNVKAAKGFSVGTEWEFSNNFCWTSDNSSFVVNPTIALKYVF